MHPALLRAADVATDLARRGVALIRLHPVIAGLALPALLLAYVLLLIPFTPSINDLRKAKTEVPAQVLSADGAVLAEYRRINRQWVKLKDISPHVIDALIATEDRRFYQHHGIDIRRLASAALSTLKGDLQGGSTITQQLARNMYPEEIGRAASIHRKAKEAVTALKIEAVYSKDEILETYLNTVPFLYNAFGIEMAARTYFDKSAHDLDVLQSATLIGMLKGTSYYNPVSNPERAVQRRNLVLAQMAGFGKLEPGSVQALSARPLRLDFERQSEPVGPAPHVAMHLRKWLIEWADRRGYNIYSDGLVIRTTLNSRMQKTANQAVARQMQALQPLADARRRKGEERQLLQAGFLALDPRSGHVLAWVGSRDFAQEQFDHVAQARRQPGSTFKPFVYGAAFVQGMSPETTFIDQPVSIRIGGGAVWSPTDATPPTGDSMTLREGLSFSKNTITAQLMERVGPARVARLAQSMGIRQSKLELVPSLALGTSPVTLKEMVAAYGTIANGGSYIEPVLVTRVEGRGGKVLEEFAPPPREEGMPHAQALTLVDVMRGVIDQGTGAAIRSRYGIRADVAGKTGTTQDNSDGWFILMHPQLVAGAWVGFNDNRVTMRSNYWGQGGHSAILLVGDFFKSVLGSGKISADALFPGGHKPEPVIRHEEAPPEEDMEEGGDMQQEGGPPADTPQPPDNEPPAPPQPDLQQEGITLPPPNDA
jgi:penicillin-binding protein 1A